MYSYGSEAVRLEYGKKSFEGEEVTVSKEEKKAAQMALRVEQLKKKALKTLAVVAAILALLMVREAQIDKLCGEVSKQKADINKLDAVIAEKEMYVSGQYDLNEIEEIALTRLGMQKPGKDECIYVTIKTEDGGEILTEETASDSGFSAFIDKAKILLEYLY